MSCHLAVFMAKLSSRLVVGLGMPVTVIALLSGYQRPSNAAMVSASTISTVPVLTDERFRGSCNSNGKSGLDMPETTSGREGKRA